MTILNKPLLSDLPLGDDEPKHTQLALQIAQQWAHDAFTNVDDHHHGLAHAHNVEKNVISICTYIYPQVSKAEKLVLRIAALLHDIGYSKYSPDWSQDRREHIKASLDFALHHLPKLPIYAKNPVLSPTTCYLIAHHDDIHYQYPSMVWEGKVQPVDLGSHAQYLDEFENSLSLEERNRLQLVLNALVVADALTATGDAGAKRTLNYSIERNLPIFAQGNPLSAWSWEESAVGNVRLAAKRALIAAFSPESKDVAQKNYDAAECFVESLCAHNGIAYYSETPANLEHSSIFLSDSSESVHFYSRSRHPDMKISFQLSRYLSWISLETTMRKVELRGDRNLLPYSNATISPRRYDIDKLRPTSYYVLRSQIEQHDKLQFNLQLQYQLGLFDLTGMIEYNQNGDNFCLAPPIVETYYESTEGATVTAIVDGVHRIWLARKLGLKEIWVVEVSNISAEFPLVPLPLNWDDVKMVDSVPPTHAKRRFRFPSIESFPDISDLTQVPVSLENYLYFFYRDLSSLGSSGIRPTQ